MVDHAIVLSGGVGERLRPLTYEVPKGLIPIRGKVLLDHVLRVLELSGIRHVVLALGYLAPRVVEYYMRTPYGPIHVSYHVEENRLDTGGALRHIYVGLATNPQCVAVLNGDNLVDVNFRAVEDAHVKSGALVTICAKLIGDVSECGSIATSNGMVTEFIEKGKSGAGVINTGYYLFSSDAFDLLPLNRPYSLERELFPALARDGKLGAYDIGRAQWFDAGTFDRWDRIVKEWAH